MTTIERAARAAGTDPIFFPATAVAMAFSVFGGDRAWLAAVPFMDWRNRGPGRCAWVGGMRSNGTDWSKKH